MNDKNSFDVNLLFQFIGKHLLSSLCTTSVDMQIKVSALSTKVTLEAGDYLIEGTGKNEKECAEKFFNNFCSNYVLINKQKLELTEEQNPLH